VPRAAIFAAIAALALCAVAAGSGHARKPLAVKVDHARVYYDGAGPGKGELLVRVFTDYGRRGLTGKWWGLTEVTIRGPGGSVMLRDIDRLNHPELGERIDHRMLLHPAAARRIMGRAGARAHLSIVAAAYMLPRRGPAGATRALCCAVDMGAGLNVVSSFPPEQRTFGNGALTVVSTEFAPFQSYASRLVVVQGGVAINDIEASASGLLHRNGSFSATGTDDCGDAASFSGTVTPPKATVRWSSPTASTLGGCTSASGSATYSIDP
jgi:hypothetical protein